MLTGGRDPGSHGRSLAGGVVNAVIAIGCLIKGETMHFEYISEAVSHGIMDLGLKAGTAAPAGEACST